MKKNVSQKGTYGHVGAPPKNVKYPRTRFTIAKAVALNKGVCELTIRNRIKLDVKAGTLVTLPVIPQTGGAVGRPKFAFQLKELATTQKPAKTNTLRKTATVVTVTPQASAPVTPTPAVTTPVATTPAVNPTNL